MYFSKMWLSKILDKIVFITLKERQTYSRSSLDWEAYHPLYLFLFDINTFSCVLCVFKQDMTLVRVLAQGRAGCSFLSSWTHESILVFVILKWSQNTTFDGLSILDFHFCSYIGIHNIEEVFDAFRHQAPLGLFSPICKLTRDGFCLRSFACQFRTNLLNL